jgi:hypothetical protein
MRKVVVGLVGLALAVGLIGQPQPSEAVDSCSVNGAYDLNGFGFNDTEVVGSLTFTPSVVCTGGTFTGSVTVKVDGSPAGTFPVSGVYTVDGDSTLNITATGLVTLTGRVSQLANNLANAIHTIGDVSGAINVAVTMTRSTVFGAPGILDRSPGAATVSNSTTPTNVYSFTVPANTLLGGKLLRGRLLYDYEPDDRAYFRNGDRRHTDPLEPRHRLCPGGAGVRPWGHDRFELSKRRVQGRTWRPRWAGTADCGRNFWGESGQRSTDSGSGHS